MNNDEAANLEVVNMNNAVENNKAGVPVLPVLPVLPELPLPPMLPLLVVLRW